METKKLLCPKCNQSLMRLVPGGTTLYCKKCEKYYINNKGEVGEETSSPYTKAGERYY